VYIHTCIVYTCLFRIYMWAFGGGIWRVGLCIYILIYTYVCVICFTDVLCNVWYAASRCGWGRFELLAIRERHLWNRDSVWIAFSELYWYAHPHRIHTKLVLRLIPVMCVYITMCTRLKQTYVCMNVCIYIFETVWPKIHHYRLCVFFACVCRRVFMWLYV